MNAFTLIKMRIYWILVFCLLIDPLSLVLAQDIPKTIRKAIEMQFPGAKIKGTEKEMWKHQPATEVELIARDGTEYEVFVSQTGEILHINKEKELPLIGGKLSIGIGLRGEREIYKNEDSEFELTPFLNYENGPLEINMSMVL